MRLMMLLDVREALGRGDATLAELREYDIEALLFLRMASAVG